MPKNPFGQLENPYRVCAPCGQAANYLTCLKRYGAPPHKIAFDVSTFSYGRCDVCKRKAAVTAARDFFYPEFALLLKALKLFNPKKWKEIRKIKIS